MNAIQTPKTKSAPTASDQMTDNQRAKAITVAIRNADTRMRERFGFLKHQSAIGVFTLVSMTGICALSGYAYVMGYLAFWAVIMINAFCLALVRELEHDLVHNLYFQKTKRAQDAMMWAVWPLLGNLPHPWFRREIHLLHHKTSGHDEDLEERLIGNGMRFGFLKLLAMVEPVLAIAFRKKELRQIDAFDEKKLHKACFPVVFAYYGTLVGFIGCQLVMLAVALAGYTVAPTLANVAQVFTAVAVIWVFPNMLRQMSVQILSSWMHYYGDIDSRLHETQVMNAWYLMPLNLFTANFGSTHSIHHFYAAQPFYLRQMCSADAHAAFEKYGIRYNDAASLLRGNRFAKS